MTTLPTPGERDFDVADEALVVRLANDIFREGPTVADSAATQATHFDGVPGAAANAMADLAATAASSSYRADPTLTSFVPVGAVPPAAPGALGTAASSPSSFALRSAPLGQVVPAHVVDPWHQMARQLPQPAPDWPDAGNASFYFLRPAAPTAREGHRAPGLPGRPLTLVPCGVTSPHCNSA